MKEGEKILGMGKTANQIMMETLTNEMEIVNKIKAKVSEFNELLKQAAVLSVDVRGKIYDSGMPQYTEYGTTKTNLAYLSIRMGKELG